LFEHGRGKRAHGRRAVRAQPRDLGGRELVPQNRPRTDRFDDGHGALRPREHRRQHLPPQRGREERPAREESRRDPGIVDAGAAIAADSTPAGCFVPISENSTVIVSDADDVRPSSSIACTRSASGEPVLRTSVSARLMIVCSFGWKSASGMSARCRPSAKAARYGNAAAGSFVPIASR
jgi:hypothetical protein